MGWEESRVAAAEVMPYQQEMIPKLVSPVDTGRECTRQDIGVLLCSEGSGGSW